MILKNFRSYKDIEITFDSKLNIIVGKNDVGKSTILEALDIFMEGDAIKIDTSDLNVDSKEKEITIGIAFEIEEDQKILLDADVKTDLKTESLLNKDGYLEIHKKWDCTRSLSKKSLSICFQSYYFDEFKENSLITLKNTELKKELTERKLEENCPNQTINSEIRKTIYKSLGEQASKSNLLIRIDKEDAKKTWESLENELPMCFLFQSDRANKDSDKDVQNPLRAITKEAISTLERELEGVTDKIKEKINELGKLTIEKLKEMAPEIAESLKLKVTNKAWDSLFNFSFDDERDIPINKRGSGVRRLILLNYFRAEAEKKSNNNRRIVYAIEEPETSQHPDYQIKLIEALQKISEKSNSQVFITTHTPEIAKLCNKESLILLEKEHDQTNQIKGDDKLKKIVNTLGILPYLCKFCVFVEGKNDVLFFEHISKINELKSIIDIKGKNISILPLNGGNLSNWNEKGYIEESNIKAFYLFDDDDSKNKQEIEKINKKNNGSFGLTTGFSAVENYFPPDLIEKNFKIQFTDNEKQEWKSLNVVKLVKEKKPQLEEKDVKNKIAKEIVKELTKESFKRIGVWDEIKSWFEKIKEMYHQG